MRYNNRPISGAVSRSVITFVMTYFICFFVIAFLLSVSGVDMMTAVSASASTISNVGPGLGEVIGPSGNYAGLGVGVKWILCVAMLLGRLELFTILVMFSPAFWRR